MKIHSYFNIPFVPREMKLCEIPAYKLLKLHINELNEGWGTQLQEVEKLANCTELQNLEGFLCFNIFNAH